MKGIKLRRKIMIFIAVLTALTAALFVYGEEYYDLRDSEISMVLPDGWEIEEIEKDQSDGDYEKIFVARENKKDMPLQLDVYYHGDEISQDEYIYFSDDEEEAMEYYSQYGIAALEGLYTQLAEEQNADLQYSVSLGEAEFFQGQWNGFIRVPVRVISGAKNFNDLVYITASTTENNNFAVSNILMFHNGGDLEKDSSKLKQTELLADGFFDYSYGSQMMGDEYDGSDEAYDDGYDSGLYAEDIITDIIFLAVFIIIIIAIVRIVKKKRTIAKRKTKVRTEKVKEKNMTVSVGTGTQDNMTDAESRYIQSLKTLHSSGLLTKDEMTEMIERHYNNIRRRGTR